MERIGRREFLIGCAAGILGLGLENICNADGPRASLPRQLFLESELGRIGNNASDKQIVAKRKRNPASKSKSPKKKPSGQKEQEKELQELEPLFRNIYMTIDDAPSDYMPLVLSNLGKNNAVFFVYGEQVYPRRRYMMAQALASGNILGNHSFLHHHYSGMPLNEIKKDIEKTDKLIEELYKEAGIPRRHKLIRFPYIDSGYYKDERGDYRGTKEKEAQVLAFVRKAGYKVMPYTCNSFDYKTQEKGRLMSADSVLANCSKAKDRDIVLCHCIPVTAERVVPFFVNSKAYELLLPEPNVNI
jgi:peptidoglycan/xylan/chitin deacetylase (PgdA/CDA1 family)